eukprot:scaffold1501_cov138-Isochrysis_galbana.AAC.1
MRNFAFAGEHLGAGVVDVERRRIELRDSKVAEDLSEVGNLGRGQGSRHNLGLGGGEGDALLTLARVREGSTGKTEAISGRRVGDGPIRIGKAFKGGRGGITIKGDTGRRGVNEVTENLVSAFIHSWSGESECASQIPDGRRQIGTSAWYGVNESPDLGAVFLDELRRGWNCPFECLLVRLGESGIGGKAKARQPRYPQLPLQS